MSHTDLTEGMEFNSMKEARLAEVFGEVKPQQEAINMEIAAESRAEKAEKISRKVKAAVRGHGGQKGKGIVTQGGRKSWWRGDDDDEVSAREDHCTEMVERIKLKIEKGPILFAFYGDRVVIVTSHRD